MRAFYVEADYAPREGYVLSQREKDTGRALRGNKIWKNIRGSVVDRPMPVCGDDQVLLKVGAAGICGTDQHLLRKDADGYTMYDGHSKYPIITGHEFSGEIVEVGKNVKKLAVGDLVSVESMHWCGQCDACRRGMFNQCKDLEEPGLTYDGGFAEYAAVNAKYCYKLNDIMNFYPVMAKSLAIGGKTAQIGHTVGLTPVDVFGWQWNAAIIAGSNGQSGQGIYPDVIALMASGRIDMRKMCTGRYNLEDIDEGMKIMAGKVLISTEYPRLKK